MYNMCPRLNYQVRWGLVPKRDLKEKFFVRNPTWTARALCIPVWKHRIQLTFRLSLPLPRAGPIAFSQMCLTFSAHSNVINCHPGSHFPASVSFYVALLQLPTHTTLSRNSCHLFWFAVFEGLPPSIRRTSSPTHFPRPQEQQGENTPHLKPPPLTPQNHSLH